MTPTVIHVHQQRIRRNINRAAADREPPVIVHRGRARAYGNSVAILGPDGQPIAQIHYSPDKPLACGARVWISTAAPVEVIA